LYDEGEAFYSYSSTVIAYHVVPNLERCLEQPHTKMLEFITTEPIFDECLEALKAIWQLHTLAFAFEVPVEIIRCPPGESVDTLDAKLFLLLQSASNYVW